ncbi:AraC family transcriptional regulator [Spirosoma radiotolerans]|uniref:AraC family transcriptional regulator n=1 Tax=Spirosoma radiotolerans TaxID=1379870 RepID=A0A0E3ZRX4_9BACT|nr:helix-turn-helix domain-containing protein [Spirosoma radiotolerans]AKD53853.1 AraC family transcriptional regulator [Spirosoma radiotolerans]
MNVTFPLPPAHLTEFVQRILVIENVRVVTPFKLPLYANGTPTLVFQTAKGQIKGYSTHLTLFGQTVRPETLSLQNDFTLIAYFFKPFVLGPLFGVAAQELTDHPIALDLLESSKVATLMEQLLHAPSTRAMLILIDHYIYSLVVQAKMDLRLIEFATASILKNTNPAVLQTVQNKLGLTERTFQRMFENHIGISPNQYRRICQFNSAFQQLQQRKFDNLADIAFKHEYADQSHFIRSFKEFTGIRPTDYLNFGRP